MSDYKMVRQYKLLIVETREMNMFVLAILGYFAHWLKYFVFQIFIPFF